MLELRESRYWDESIDKLLLKDSLKKEDREIINSYRIPENREAILKEIEEGIFNWGIPKKLELVKPGSTKKRVVYMYGARERVVMGAIYRMLQYTRDDLVSSACFSYRKGVRTLDAVQWLVKDSKLHNKWAVKLDIHAYFNSLSREEIFRLVDLALPEMLPVNKALRDLYSDDRCVNGNEVINEYKSLIPGTAIAAYFANICLKDLDEQISNMADVTYARYSDDIIIFAEEKQKVEECLDLVKQALAKRGLEVNPKKYEWYKPEEEVTYLGLRFYRDDYNKEVIDIGKETAKKVKVKWRNYCKKKRKAVELKAKRRFKSKDKEYVRQLAIKEVKKFFSRYNKVMFKSYVLDETKYGWCYYAFRYINTIETIKEIDFYMMDMARYLLTGCHNKAGIRDYPLETLKELGYVSLVDMYNYFCDDFDVYTHKCWAICDK